MILDHILPSVGALSSVTIISHEEFELLLCNRNKDTPFVIGYSIHGASRCLHLISIQQTRSYWLPGFPAHSIVQIATWACLNKHKEYLWTSKWILYFGHIMAELSNYSQQIVWWINTDLTHYSWINEMILIVRYTMMQLRKLSCPKLAINSLELLDLEKW